MSLPKDFEPKYGQGKQSLLSSAEATRLGSELFPVLRRNALANDVKDIVLGRQLRPDSPLNVQYDPNSQQKPVHSEVTGLDYPDDVYGKLRMRAEETHKALEEVQQHEKTQEAQAKIREIQLKALQHQGEVISFLLGDEIHSKKSKIIPSKIIYSHEELPAKKKEDILEKRWPRF